MKHFVRVQSVEALQPWIVRVRFSNDEIREIDLADYIATGPIYEPIRQNEAFFRSVYVDGGTIVWPNGADIDPDVLYYDGTPPWAQTSNVAADAP